MSARRIDGAAWGLPPDWVAWRLGMPEEAEAEARPLCADERTLAAVMAAVRRFEAIAAEEVPGTVASALWVPETSRRRPMAVAALRVLVPPSQGPRWDLEGTLQYARTSVHVPRGVRLLDVAALPSRVVAGESVLQIVDTAPRFRRRLSREWAWFILPPGTDRTVMVHVESTEVQHFDEIADMTTAIANSVDVTLADR